MARSQVEVELDLLDILESYVLSELELVEDESGTRHRDESARQYAAGVERGLERAFRDILEQIQELRNGIDPLI